MKIKDLISRGNVKTREDMKRVVVEDWKNA
jgi:hypothetical protein